MKCSVGDCEKDLYAKGHCRKHYRQMKVYGAIVPDPERRDTCLIEECSKGVKAKGYCSTHYARLQRTGQLTRRSYARHVGCKVEGCDGPHSSKGYCKPHYSRFRVKGVADFEANLPVAPLRRLVLLEMAAWNTAEEAAQYLGVTHANLYRLLRPETTTLRFDAADRWAIRLGTHPVLLWPEEWMAVA